MAESAISRKPTVFPSTGAVLQGPLQRVGQVLDCCLKGSRIPLIFLLGGKEGSI